MSEARFRRILLLVVFVFVFYLPGTLAFAAPHDHGGGDGNSNGHGQGQDSPDDHDNGFGNDDTLPPDPEPDPADTPDDPNDQGQGQDSPDDHDNGFGNDDTLPPDPEPDPADTPDDPIDHGQGQDSPDDQDNGYDIENDPLPPDPGPEDAVAPDSEPAPDPADTPDDPNDHGQGQDSPDDQNNGYGNDDPLPPDPEPDDAVAPDPEPAPDPQETTEIPNQVNQVEEPPTVTADIQLPPDAEPDILVVGDPSPEASTAHEPVPTNEEIDDETEPELAIPLPATGPIETEPANQPPFATPGQTVVFAGSTTTIDLSSFVVDSDGDDLELISHTLPAHGTLTVTNGVALFTPEPGFFGIETLRFTACDPSGACIDTTVSVFVPPVNDILIATNDPEILTRFMVGADLGLSHGELVADLLADSATRLAVPMAGAVSVIGGSLLFGLHKIGTRFDLLRMLLRRN